MRTKSVFRICVLLVLSIVLGVVMSCEQSKKVTPTQKPAPAPAPTPKPENTGPVVSWENHSDYCIRVKNETAINLIAFKSAIEKDKMLGGIKAGDTVGLKRNPQLFAETCDFPVLFVTEEQYNKHKNNLSGLKDIFTSLYAFYNKNAERNPDNEVLYRVSSKLGGDARVVCTNNSKYNIELRLNSPDGEVLGYVPSMHANIILNVTPLTDMVIFPVFRRYSPKKKEMYSIKPVDKFGKPIFDQKVFKVGDNNLELGALWEEANQAGFTTGGCYITLINNHSKGMSLYKARERLRTSINVSTVNSGEQETYFIPFPTVGQNTLPDTLKLKIGAGHFVSGPVYTAAEFFEFKKDCVYKLEVTGSTSEVILSDITPYDISGNGGVVEDGVGNKLDVEKALFGE